MANLDGVFRREWGPAAAALARWLGDLTVAEDAVQEAFAEALRLAEGSTGSYLPQAVIAALHPVASSWEQTDWAAICSAYDRLLAVTDSPVVQANRALAVGFRDGYAAGLAELDAVADNPRLARSGLLPSIRADLLRRDGRPAEALPCYRQAFAVTGSEPARSFLRRRIAECGGAQVPRAVPRKREVPPTKAP